jgi:hypothetical protein
MSRSEHLPPASSATAAERLAVIVDAAERAALKVIDDAEKEARRYLEEAKARADRIVAERLRDLADELDEREQAPARHLREVEPPPEGAGVSASAEDEEGDQFQSSAAARLLATQMAVSGSSREEIETRLRNGFEIEDTREILDAILGPED